jgi:hypothetical protein
MNAVVKSKPFKPLTGYERVVLEHILKTDTEFKARDKEPEPQSVTMTASLVTKIETFKKTAVADSGVEEVIANYFTERDACLITITNWDLVADKETVLRTKIVPMLSDHYKLDPKIPVVFQFLDHEGKPMRHVPAPGPKVMRPGD